MGGFSPDTLTWLAAGITEVERGSPSPPPIPMLLWCPACHQRHVDSGDYATKPHHTHACQFCGMVWRPAIEATVGVRFLPGFKDNAPVPPGKESR